MRVLLPVTLVLLALSSVALCAPVPGGGLGYGGVKDSEEAQKAYADHYGTDFISELGTTLTDIRGKQC